MPGHQFRVNIAIQFVVDVVITDVLQGGTAGRTFEALHVKIFLLDPNEDATVIERVTYNISSNAYGQGYIIPS